MKKFLILLVVIALIASIVFTAGQLGDAFSSLEFPKFEDYFTKEEKYCTLTLQVDDGGHVSGAKAEYKKGDTVGLLASPDEGFVFSGWFTGQNTYLSTAKSYSFVIEKDTVLCAKFAEMPEEMKGQTLSYGELFGCGTDFAFTVYCDRADAENYLMNNLRVVDSDLLGTQWEEQGQVPFAVSAGQEQNEYLISPAAGASYEPGTTYAAVLPEGGSFLDPENDQTTLNFTIQEENKEEITYRDGIAYLSDVVLEVADGEGDTGASDDYPYGYVLLRGNVQLAADSIFCVYSGNQADGQPQLDADSFFGKVVSSQADGGNTRIYYRLPNLSEVYDDLDVVYSGGVDWKAAGVSLSAKSMKQARSGLLSNVGFQNFVAAAQQAVVNQYGNEYDVQLLSAENFSQLIQVTVSPSFYGDCARVWIQVTLDIPILKKGTDQTVGQFAFRLDVSKEIELSTYFKLKQRQLDDVPVDIESYDIHVSVTEQEKLTLEVSFSSDGSPSPAAWEAGLNQEFEKLLSGEKPLFLSVADIFRQNGYEPAVQTRLDLFQLEHTVGMAKFLLDVDMDLDLELIGNLYYTAQSVKSTTVGIRSGANGPVTYESFSGQANPFILMAAGNAGIDVPLCVAAKVSVAGLARQMEVDMDFKSGIRHSLGGCINMKDPAVYAGFVETVGSWQAKVDYQLLGAAGVETSGSESPVCAYGYKQAIVGYEKQENLNDSKTATVAILDSSADLFAYDLLKVSVLNAADGSITTETLRADSGNYTVEVKTDKYLQYDPTTGTLTVKQNAPAYFTEKIVIAVKAANTGWKAQEDGKASCFLPTVTVTVIFGDEDAYYASADTDLEKEFRVLYREYNANNAAFLQENFKRILSKLQVPGEYAGIMDGLINNYLDNLFTTIEDYRKLETPGSRDMENKFVRTETGPFALTMDVFGKITDQSRFDKETVTGWVDQLLASEAMYRTILEFGQSDACKILAEQFAAVDQQTKDAVSAAISEFEAKHTGNGHAMDIAAAVRKILGL